MRRWVKRLLIVAGVAAVVAAVGYFVFGDRLAAVVAQRALARVQTAAAARGVRFDRLEFARASLAGWSAIRCDQLTGIAHLDERLRVARWSDFMLTAEQIVVELGPPWRGAARIEVWGGDATMLDQSGIAVGDSVARINAQVTLPFSWRRPSAVAVVLDDEMRRLWSEGRTVLPLRVTATARFALGSGWHELPVRAQPDPRGGATLALDPADVRALSQRQTHALTEAEIALVARNPLRAPVLLRLSDRAARTALAERRRDRTFPHDAYRHVYWSWLLTREFGPEFAEQVTTAHEIDATYETGEEARRMDLHNNAIGRAYALQGVPEAELVQRVLTDPDVQRRAVVDR